jgi:hypothetical protein
VNYLERLRQFKCERSGTYGTPHAAHSEFSETPPIGCSTPIDLEQDAVPCVNGTSGTALHGHIDVTEQAAVVLPITVAQAVPKVTEPNGVFCGTSGTPHPERLQLLRRDNFEFADKYVRARVSTGRLCYGGFRKPNARLLAMLVGEFKRQGFR